MNKIIQGNCLEIMKDIPDKSIDMVLTSPPYNMRTRIRNGKYTTREKSEHFSKKYKYFGDDLPIEDFYNFHKECITEMLRISKVVIYNFQIVTGSKEAFFKIVGDFNKDIKDIIIWDKGFGQPAMHEKVLSSAYEMLLIMEDDKKCGRVIQNATFKRGEMQNILRMGRGKKMSEIHSAIFPEKLAEEIIKNFSNKGDTILDPFAGSGTVGKVAQELNRNYILIEREAEYIKIAEARINAWKKEKQKKLV
jgi:site-specific DNA-methyltransferase (adenine-specific)/modification methylase